MTSTTLSPITTTIHLEKDIHAPVEKCFATFRSTRALTRWYDPGAVLTEFKVEGTVWANYFPSYTIAVIVKNQLIVQSYITVIDGIGLWSFVSKGKSTRVILDHMAEGNQGEEMLARTFHWQGLLENLAAACDGRQIPFVKGQYTPGALPKGIRHATCGEYLKAARRSQ